MRHTLNSHTNEEESDERGEVRTERHRLVLFDVWQPNGEDGDFYSPQQSNKKTRLEIKKNIEYLNPIASSVNNKHSQH